MFEKEKYREDFEKSIAVPFDVYWSKKYKKYLPLPKYQTEPVFLRLAREINARHESYTEGRKENEAAIFELEKLLSRAANIIERSIFSDPHTERLANELKLNLTEKK